MPRSRTLVAGCFLCILTFCYGSLTSIHAQTNQAADPAQNNYDKRLQQLIAEVRELRLAVQKATVSNTRFQMLMERVRVQQSSVDTASRQLENIRSQLADMRSMKPQMEQQIKDTEELLDRTTDPNGRLDVESRLKSMKARLARFAPEEERLRNREIALESDLQNSQNKLSELNSQLDGLFNELKLP